MRRFIITAASVGLIALTALVVSAGYPVDPVSYEGSQETIEGFTVEYTKADDGGLQVKVTNAAGESHLHALPSRGFWGYVTNNGSAVDAVVAINLRWSGTDRSTEDAYACPICGFYYKYCDTQGAYSMLASIDTNSGHAPLADDGYRCHDELVRQDFPFNVTAFYMKLCPPEWEEK